MSDSSEKDFEVAVRYGGKPDTLTIRAASERAAKAQAAEVLKSRRRKPDTVVIGATEKRKKP